MTVTTDGVRRLLHSVTVEQAEKEECKMYRTIGLNHMPNVGEKIININNKQVQKCARLIHFAEKGEKSPDHCSCR